MDLITPVSNLPTVGPAYARKLEKLEIRDLEDLLLHIPYRYNDFRLVTGIANTQPGETITVQGNLKTIKNIYTRSHKVFEIGEVEDGTGTMQVVWFNQVYLPKTLKPGSVYSFAGKVSTFDGKLSMISPDYEKMDNGKSTIHTGRLVPVYPETRGVSSKFLRTKVSLVLKNSENELDEFLPAEILEKYGLVTFRESILSVHFPSDPQLAEKARKRLAFNELLFQHIKSLKRKSEWAKTQVSHQIKTDSNLFRQFITSLPFELTESQHLAIEEIFKDLSEKTPMNRLLEGDVGSGKTVVAAAAMFASFTNGYQSVLMAPTQILAEQHFATLNKIFETFKIRVSLITSQGITSDVGKADIFVGTHALIHKKIKFDNVALVVIDEQHRFGVEQREHLVKKSKKGKYVPNVLTTTATPIPRTIALTLYGDLSLSVLNELPKGRKPITTWLLPKNKREGAYGWIKEQVLKDNIQVFFICPLIEESEVETMKTVKAAKATFEELTHAFPGLHIGLLHGKQKAEEKNKTLEAFKKGDTDILVATPVVEVGIDVPNATIMVIEAGERYGLAQLHQLRGRIGRGDKKSYCMIFTNNQSQKVSERLNALTKAYSGFDLAELDLKLRGPGEIFGTRQHGFPELKIANWGDSELIKITRSVAEKAIAEPDNFGKLFEKLRSKQTIPN